MQHEFKKLLWIKDFPTNGNLAYMFLDTLRPGCEIVSSNQVPYKATKGDKLHFYPKCTVPRVKLREWGKKVGVTSGRLPGSNIKIISKKAVNFYCKDKIGLVVKTSEFKNWYKKNIAGGFALEAVLDNYQEKYMMLPYHIENEVIGNSHSFRFVTHLKDQINTGAEYCGYRHSKVIELEGLNLLNDPECFMEEDVIAEMTSFDTILTNDQYEGLDNLFKSNDATNHEMALEILACSNYKESLWMILPLITSNYNAIINCKSRNSVNFKSLLTYIGANIADLHMNTCIKILKHKKLLTSQSLAKFAGHLADNMNQQIKNTVFHVANMGVDKATQQYLKENQ